jgi:predicted GNAT family acetyltransferase
MVQPDVAYIANMYTLPECRRKGYARAILTCLLSDAAGSGARHGLLVSSHAGYLLYQSAGFQHHLDCLVLTSP